ncbi:hypoxanthine phosphoribosyltransferase [Desulfosoma caldarium]|uniref:Hypoxanthine phosphoribosyltransferase n=1 Tax=Desulfosoma caldarium TaxID=610254 RepID=A0A3N1UUK8_9BACT|nr:hypoxanthine phosphoribosyltransferase [Desulfosoma caldarium]ROQ90806.1 hypoxanthine phosphoribosyltransferase [Desulfosoma caldarium]
MNAHRLVLKISKDEIQNRVRALAAQIASDYQGKDLVMVGVLKGAFIFLADLIRSLDMPVEVDFIRIASYGTSTESSGGITLSKDLECSIDGRDVLVVEDIVDTGLTMRWLMGHLQRRNPRTVKICALIDKYERRAVEMPVHYAGFRIPSGFVVGYGLDFAEKYRGLQGIYEVAFDAMVEGSHAG